MDLAIYNSRRRRNVFATAASYTATGIGLAGLALILGVLFWEGFSGLSLAVFTEMTPPPGSAGGLLNAIVGSILMTVIAIVIGTPVGMLAGTYMAEYGRHEKISSVVRFINDILLSAPSIVIGLFIYEVMVVPMGHFSAMAGAVALAVIVLPVVVRTTEDMLLLVPDTQREAAAALGAPRAVVVGFVEGHKIGVVPLHPVGGKPLHHFRKRDLSRERLPRALTDGLSGPRFHDSPFADGRRCPPSKGILGRGQGCGLEEMRHQTNSPGVLPVRSAKLRTK